MKVKIYWNEENTNELNTKVISALEELGLSDFISIELTNDENLKTELNIKNEPALIIEEESIDFRDTIFEWIIPSDEEIKAMFISIIGGSDTGSSCSSGGCWTCGSSC